MCHFCFAQARSRLDQRVEHGLQVKGGAADHLKYVRRGGLLLQRFAQLVEQPRVFDRHDGLFREIAHKLHLLVAERSHLLPINGYRSDGLVFLEHWHCHVAARAAEFGRVIREKLPFSRSISEEDGSLHADDVLKCASDCGLKWSALSDELCERRRDVEFCRRAQSAVFVVEHHAELCFAKSRGVFQHALEYWLKLTGRAQNTCNTSAVAVCCCSESRSSFSRRVFSMAITAWAAKFWSSSTCLSVNGRTSWR